VRKKIIVLGWKYENYPKQNLRGGSSAITSATKTPTISFQSKIIKKIEVENEEKGNEISSANSEGENVSEKNTQDSVQEKDADNTISVHDEEISSESS
jgi:DNA-binding LacI/PurR family transcriptional regulator